MKNVNPFFILLFFFCLELSAQTTKNQTKKELVTNAEISKMMLVSGKVMQIFSYCGGAEMPPEMLLEYSKPKPYSGKVFYIRKGKVNSTKEPIVLSFTVNAMGKFSFKLPPGNYSIIQEPQVKALNLKLYNKDGVTIVDKDCLKKWWAAPYYILKVKDGDISNLNFEFQHPCFVSGDNPCLHYDGPLPP